MYQSAWVLPDVTCCVDNTGDVALLTLPKGTATAIEVPQSGTRDGTADYLANLSRAAPTIRQVVLGRGHALFGLGALSNGAVHAFVHEASRTLRCSLDALLPLFVGERDVLAPMGPLVSRLAMCQQTLDVEPNGEGWMGGTMPFMTPCGLMTLGNLSVGSLQSGTNRVIYLVTTARVAPEVLREIAHRLAHPFFGWLEGIGVQSSADALVLSATGTMPSINIQSIEDPQAMILQTALSVWVEKTIATWGRTKGLVARVRLEGALNEEELTRVVRSVTAAGRWLGTVERISALRGVVLEAIRCATLINDSEADRWIAIGDESLSRQTQDESLLSAFRGGELRLTIHLGRGPFSTTFVV